MNMDMNVFEHYEIWMRGDVVGKRERLKWFKVEEKQVPIFQRLVLLMKLRPHRRLGREVDTASVYVRIYKDIPKQDLEMLFPVARPLTAWWDRGKIGLPLLSGSGIVGSKLLAAGFFAIVSGLVLGK